MVTIEVTNDKCKLVGNIKTLNKVKKAFKVKNPNAFFIRMRAKGIQPNWDGMVHYVTEANYFKVGLLPQVYRYITEVLEEKVEFVDHRLDFNVKPKTPKKVGDLTPMVHQIEAIESITQNKVGKMDFPVGAINAATNAGKTLIMAGIYLAYKRKIPAIVLLNDGDLFEQFKRELPSLVGDDFGYVRGKDAKWGKFTIAMVQTVSQKIGLYRAQLRKKGIVLVDEADLADNKTYKTVLQNCTSANVRVALSGSLFLSQLKKDFVKNQNIHSFFGDEVYNISKKELVDKGVSTEVMITMYKGSTKVGIKGDFKGEYDRSITYNEERAKVCSDIIRHNAKVGRLPAIVVCQYHNHTELMYQIFKRELGHKYTIAYVHHKVKERTKIFKDFREGKIDILISTFIIKRGKNFPLTRYLLNAAGSDSHETILQIMGRLERKHDSKKRAYLGDLWDEGVYLKRHSKHRLSYYKKTGFKVKEKYK